MATLIIAEKPNACKKIVEAIADTYQTKKRGGVAYYEFVRKNKTYYAVPAVGHLFNLTHKRGARIPIFDVSWAPSHTLSDASAFTKKYLDNFVKLKKSVKDIIVATDYDIEGSVIAFTILENVFGKHDAKRMKFSTLTKEDLVHAFDHMHDHINRGFVNAGVLRHHLDYFWGVNASRALMNSIKEAGRFRILSIGRVQGPTLKLLYDREKEIEQFISTTFFELSFTYKGVVCEHAHTILEKQEAKKLFNKVNKKVAVVTNITVSDQHLTPPEPFNLTTLQTTAHRVFKFSPKKTLDLAQSLYEHGLISYPRTSSQKLPLSIGYEKILKKLAKIKTYAPLCESLLKKTLKPREGKKTDPAHPAIYPTGELVDVSGAEKKLYDLIVRRFFAAFGERAVKELTKIAFDVCGVDFYAHGHTIKKPGFLTYYAPYDGGQEKLLEHFEVGQRITPDSFENAQKQTKPPSRYSQASLIHMLDKRDLGTKATRTGIIKTLYDRGYLEDTNIHVTELGMTVVDILKKYSPKLVSIELTSETEKNMKLVESHKRNKDAVLEDAKTHLVDILNDFKKHAKSIGSELAKAVKEDSALGPCSACGQDLRVIHSRRTGKLFVGCSGYPKCTNSYPLPQHGLVKNVHKACKTCTSPLVLLIKKGKRPWQLCINPQCPTKEEYEKKLRPKTD